MDRNPQAAQMADASMSRNLAAQAEAIWPQEAPLVATYTATSILDVGCGTGEITSRLAGLFQPTSRSRTGSSCGSRTLWHVPVVTAKVR